MAGIDSTDNEWMGAETVFDKFVSLGMINKESNGDVTIKNWSKRQNSYLTSAERSKKWRDKQKRHSGDTFSSVERNARVEENRIEKNNTGDFSKEKGNANAKHFEAGRKLLREKKLMP